MKFPKSSLVTGVLLLSLFLTIGVVRQTLAAPAPLPPHPIKHSTPKVQLTIKSGRIFFEPNTIACAHTSKPCFFLQYAGGNYGPRPLWLNGRQEFVLQHGQSLPFTFTTPGIELFTLFKISPWWKIRVVVS